MWRKSLVMVLVLIMIAGVVPLGAATAQDAPGVSDARFARLARGVNLPFWFWYGPENDTLLRIHFTETDFATIKGLGFTFVRLPIDLEFVMDPAATDLLRAEHLQYIDLALDRALAADLAVIVDIHSVSLAASDASDYSAGLEDPAFADVFITFWESFAAYLSDRDPDMVFFEPMNEPVFLDHPQDWLPIQERLLYAIRASAPEHTLIASGAEWSGLDQLLALQPLDDPNLVYNFHFYEPFLFTHQGATWTWWVVESLRQVPYPSSPDAVEPALALVRDDEVRQELAWYGEERWDAEALDALISQAAVWAENNGGLRVICGEFGVHKPYAPPEDRVQWHHDIVATFEKYGIGWALWEYDSSFGLVERRGGDTKIDVALAEAMGLTVGAQ
jgi:endoglucanase